MRTLYVGSVGLAVGALFGVLTIGHASSSDIIINEIAAYPTSTHEWVELYNRGTDTIDITGWKFADFDGTKLVNHGLNPVSTPQIGPGTFAIIAQNAAVFSQDHPGLAVPIFGSSWSSLSTNGELISLLDNTGATVESFSYLPAPTAALERKNSQLNDYTAINWYERASGNSAGFINSVSVEASPATSVSAFTGPNSSSTPRASWVGIRLNEIMPDPVSGAEWVELFNLSDTPIDLTGLTLCDNRATSCTIAQPTSTIAAHSFSVVVISGSKLNNDGDSVILKDPSGQILDQISYGTTLVVHSGQTIARSPDGTGSWAVTTQPTLQAVNTIIAPPVAAASAGSGAAQTADDDLPLETTNPSYGIIWYVTSTAPVVLSEIFPHPASDETKNEFIEVWNKTANDALLTGWKLWVDGKQFSLSGELGPDERRAWYRSVTGIELSNSTSSEVRLLNADQGIADVVFVPHPPTALAYSRQPNNVWQWALPTPHIENATSLGALPKIIWQPIVPQLVMRGDTVWFKAGTTADPRGGRCGFTWIVEGKNYQTTDLNYRFATSGTYVVSLAVSSTQGTVGRKEFTVVVHDAPIVDVGNVQLSEVVIAPDDEASEFIELFNADTKTVRLDGWRLSTKSGKPFIIPDATAIAPGTTLVFYQTVTGLALGAAGDTVQLVTASQERSDRVVVPKAAVGASYQRIDGVWRTIPGRTPGQILTGFDGAGGGDEARTLPSVKKKTSVTKKSATTKKSSSAKPKTTTARRVTVAESLALPKGAKVVTRGIIAALPGTFGVQYSALTTEDAGILLYQNQKQFPELNLGDEVEVRGTISEAQGRKRLTVARVEDIDILSTDHEAPLVETTINKLSAHDQGKLVAITGEITSKKSATAYIDDATDELKIVLKAGSKISTKTWKIGQHLKATGFLVVNGKELELWPRSTDDIEFSVATSSKEEIVDQKNMQTETGVAPASSSRVYQVLVGGLLLINLGSGWQLYRLSKKRTE